MAAELSQKIITCTNGEYEVAKEIISYIRESRERQKNKSTTAQIGKVIVKIFNLTVEIEPGIYPGVKSFKE